MKLCVLTRQVGIPLDLFEEFKFWYHCIYGLVKSQLAIFITVFKQRDTDDGETCRFHAMV
jgi:hypothetical protein